MFRSVVAMVLGGYGKPPAKRAVRGDGVVETVQTTSSADTAAALAASARVVVVPGYGMANAHAQHALAAIAAALTEMGVEVTFAVHPVAGRMPGQMNLLLGEADVPYEQLVEMDAANADMAATDVALVVGATDIVNLSYTDESSPLYGMPMINVWEARQALTPHPLRPTPALDPPAVHCSQAVAGGGVLRRPEPASVPAQDAHAAGRRAPLVRGRRHRAAHPQRQRPFRRREVAWAPTAPALQPPTVTLHAARLRTALRASCHGGTLSCAVRKYSTVPCCIL